MSSADVNIIQQNSSDSSVGLNIAASEFIPTHRASVTGAIPKTNNPRNNTNNRHKNRNQAPRFYQDNNRDYNNDTRYYKRDNNRTRNPRFNNNNNFRKDQDRPVNELDTNHNETQVKSTKFYNDRPASYKASNKRGPPPPKKKTDLSQRDQLIRDIETGKIECMICCERIRDHQAIWNCSNCFHIQHLHCIKTWVKNSVTEDNGWRCVACQHLRYEAPRDYFCFCGKVKSPQLNRNDLPHSCGDVCGKTDNCEHPCTLTCHPGPHSLCQSFVNRNCGCGKMKKTFQCSQKQAFECDEICEKILTCGIHKCQRNCHQGECESCDVEIKMKCSCGKSSKTEICSPENALVTEFTCEKVCDTQLTCGNHKCTSLCHSGACGTCKFSPNLVTSCPCGKMKIAEGSRKSCTDEIPLCTEICDRSLKCGHYCQKRCHHDECPPCEQNQSVKCRCGRIEEKILCKNLESTDLRCKKKCTKFKSCGKHRCNTHCCIELEHICLSLCGKVLNCGKHRCQNSCHIGNCIQCSRVSFDELRCYCGSAVIYPPVACGVKVPECKKKCTRRHTCDHQVNHQCHTSPECPPCVFLTTKWCYGQHEQRKTIPCNEKSFTCGMSCGKALKCGNHSCLKKCHDGICETLTDVCKQPCTKKRNECEHNCNAPCHTDACPDKACRVSMGVTCECGNLKEMRTCEQVAYENKKIQRVKIAMQMQESGEFQMNEITSMKRTLKILTCNEECKTLERNRRLEIAFKIDNPSLAASPRFLPAYSEFAKTFYKKDSQFVNMVYEKLSSLVKLTKESKQQPRSFSFPCMNRDKRHLIHDLAAMFGVETQAYDAEPNRNIVATASKISCWLPSHSITEVIARENGLRHPPNNQKL